MADDQFVFVNNLGLPSTTAPVFDFTIKPTVAYDDNDTFSFGSLSLNNKKQANELSETPTTNSDDNTTSQESTDKAPPLIEFTLNSTPAAVSFVFGGFTSATTSDTTVGAPFSASIGSSTNKCTRKGASLRSSHSKRNHRAAASSGAPLSNNHKLSLVPNATQQHFRLFTNLGKTEVNYDILSRIVSFVPAAPYHSSTICRVSKSWRQVCLHQRSLVTHLNFIEEPFIINIMKDENQFLHCFSRLNKLYDNDCMTLTISLEHLNAINDRKKIWSVGSLLDNVKYLRLFPSWGEIAPVWHSGLHADDVGVLFPRLETIEFVNFNFSSPPIGLPSLVVNEENTKVPNRLVRFSYYCYPTGEMSMQKLKQKVLKKLKRSCDEVVVDASDTMVVGRNTFIFDTNVFEGIVNFDQTRKYLRYLSSYGVPVFETALFNGDTRLFSNRALDTVISHTDQFSDETCMLLARIRFGKDKLRTCVHLAEYLIKYRSVDLFRWFDNEMKLSVLLKNRQNPVLYAIKKFKFEHADYLIGEYKGILVRGDSRGVLIPNVNRCHMIDCMSMTPELHESKEAVEFLKKLLEVQHLPVEKNGICALATLKRVSASEDFNPHRHRFKQLLKEYKAKPDAALAEKLSGLRYIF